MRKKQVKLWFSFILFFSLFSQQVKAQQCGYEGLNAFVLNIHLSGNNELVPSLKIYLVNENNEPYFEETRFYNPKEKAYQTRRDTFIFWQNLKAKQIKHLDDFYYRFYLKGAGNSYIVPVPEYENYKELGTFLPVYQARIVDVDGKLNGGDFGTRIVRINYTESVNICNSGILDYEPNNPPNPAKIKRLDGGYFMPKDINLSFRTSLIADTGLVKHMYRTKIDTLFGAKGNDSLYAIKEIEIKNHRTLVTVQKIVFPQKFWAGNVLIKNILEYHDFFGDNPHDVNDFRILISNTKGKDGLFHKRHLHYAYSDITNQYTADTALNNYDDVEINKSTGAITRTQYLSGPIGLTKITYRYYKTKWDLQSIEKPKTAEKSQNTDKTVPKPEFPCIILIDAPQKTKVIHASDLYYITLKDTFRFINNCDKSLHIEGLRVGHNPEFSFSPSVAPFDTGFIYFNKILTITNGIMFNENAFKPDEYNLLRLNYIVIGKNALVEETSNYCKKYRVNPTGDSLQLEVISVGKNGKPISFGTMIKNDTSKYGNWKFWDDEGNITYKTFSRKVVYMAKNFDDEPIHSIDFQVKNKGKWVPLNHWLIMGNHHVYISEGMDSLKLVSNTYSNAIQLKYRSLANENFQYLYLVNKNQYALSMSGSKMPIELVPNVYRVQVDYLGQKNRDGKIGQEAFVNYFISQYPNLISKEVWPFDNEIIINLKKYTEAEKKNILRSLEKDEMILSIDQLIKLPGSKVTFCDRSGIFIMNHNLSYDSVRTFLKNRNFTYKGASTGTGNYHEFTYNNKIIDQHFFDIYNTICEWPDVIAGSLSFYFKVELDNQISPDTER